MKVAFDLLRLANERFPIPEDSQCRHSLNIQLGKLTLTIFRKGMWQ